MATFTARLYILLGLPALSWPPTFAASPPALPAPVVDRAESSEVPELSRLQRMTTTATGIRIVFSDVDGTLVHYPPTQHESEQDAEKSVAALVVGRDSTVLELPPSATGSRGIISHRTLRLCREIRRRQHQEGAGPVRLVIVSGMRTSTLLQRLPYLPRADAYCSEGGGRIFYPVVETGTGATAPLHRVVPVPFEGATNQDLQPFYVEEDPLWRRRIVMAVGDDGYHGNEIGPHEDDVLGSLPVDERTGPLWDFANHLTNVGYVVDTKGYAACFRINRKQQPDAVDFDALLRSDGSAAFSVPPELGTSTNLGCVDIYPAMSGKKNCCLYLAERFCGTSEALNASCVCLCDDDNDLEMALANRHTFIPSISSTSMTAAIERRRDHFTVTWKDGTDGTDGTAATELALERVLDLIRSESAQ